MGTISAITASIVLLIAPSAAPEIAQEAQEAQDYPVIESFERVEYTEINHIPKEECSDRDDDIIDIAAHALNAGFIEENLKISVAVALAESLGNPSATNTNNNGSIDRGLFQINSVHKWVDLDRIFDPGYNAEAAFRVWESSGWTAWYAHTPKGREYGSGERFQEWLPIVDCVIGDSYADRNNAMSQVREGTRPE